MQVEWMNHTGFIVSNMDESLKFYTNVLGLTEERNVIMEGEVVTKITGFPDARIHIVYLGTGDVKHAVELIQYLTPVGPVDPPLARNAVGAAHLGFVVDDLDSFFNLWTFCPKLKLNVLREFTCIQVWRGEREWTNEWFILMGNISLNRRLKFPSLTLVLERGMGFMK